MSRNKQHARRTRAFTVVELMFVVAIIGLLMSLAVPRALRALRASQLRDCRQNLEFVEAAKDEFAIENAQRDGYAPTWDDIQPYLRRQKVLECPSGRSYELETIGEPCRCPYHKVRAFKAD